MTEHGVQNAVRNALAGHALTFRANVGQAWTGTASRVPAGVLIRNPRPFTTGLPAGFSDLFGLVPVVIKPEHVGQTFARFFALEVKAGRGQPTDRQRDFIEAVLRNGGLAGVVRSPEDAIRIITGANDNS